MAKLIFLTLALFSAFTPAYSLPFVVFHGIEDECTNNGLKIFINDLSQWSGSQGHCIEIGNGARDSLFMPYTKQTKIACEKVKNISALSHGYNIVGLSQGSILGRSVIESCEGAPQVNNFVSLAGPHAGTASIPVCNSGRICNLVHYLIKIGLYSNYVQENFAPAGYTKIPTAINQYMQGCKFLPQLNNEYKDHKNAVYKKRFASLQNLVLIMFDDEEVLVPKETSWFGYFADGSLTKVLPVQETALYKEDWIGLRSLDEAGRVKYINVSGGHLDVSNMDMKKYIVPYLESQSVFCLPGASCVLNALCYAELAYRLPGIVGGE
ncbi:palmitoyl-protein thioesterase 1-like [Impatiens glandulifera]|uniref:palmitoyl-protein thioesterase 1-like n=1 Tax=Impatiens glandulifera TaxID=253017 RepID=UPI001FB0E278|nr:palmitoyl-protein thioesterase 1-like [Impatiens glandulifera]